MTWQARVINNALGRTSRQLDVEFSEILPGVQIFREVISFARDVTKDDITTDIRRKLAALDDAVSIRAAFVNNAIIDVTIPPRPPFTAFELWDRDFTQLSHAQRGIDLEVIPVADLAALKTKVTTDWQPAFIPLLRRK